MARVRQDGDKDGRSRTGGRSARVRAAVLDAVLAELVDKGYTALSVGEVAQRAGVHKTTVYRHWQNRDELLVAALESITADPVRTVDTGDLESDLRAYAAGVIEVLAGASGRVLQAVLTSEAGSLDGVSQIKEWIFASRRPLSARIVQRAIARGEIPAETSVNDVIDYLVAPIYFRLLLSGEQLDPALAQQSAAATAAAAQAGAFRLDDAD